MLQKLTRSTILGLTLGVLLAGYAVFAYSPPTQAPPGGNVATPVNVGASSQVKSGGLWVNSLGTDGGAMFGGDISWTGTLTSGSVPWARLTSVPGGFADGVDNEGGTPSGAVMFFNLSSCPSGWSELTNAQGRYLVGKPSGGTLSATVGEALSDQENRAVGQHSHPVNDPGHSHSLSTPRGCGGIGSSTIAPGDIFQCGSFSTNVAQTSISVSDSGTVPGTNAPYVQLLVCQKN